MMYNTSLFTLGSQVQPPVSQTCRLGEWGGGWGKSIAEVCVYGAGERRGGGVVLDPLISRFVAL